MARKTYRSANGKQIDMGALQLQYENVRAVGNMNVNARGDIIDEWNNPIDTRNNQVNKQYNRQATTNVVDEPVDYGKPAPVKKPTPRRPVAVQQTVVPDEIPTPPEDWDEDITKENIEETAPAPKPKPAAKKATKRSTTKKETTVKAVAKEPVVEEPVVAQPDEPKSTEEDVDINDLDNIESDLAKAEEPEPVVEEKKTTAGASHKIPEGGLASALAKARSISQEPITAKPKSTSGVRKF